MKSKNLILKVAVAILAVGSFGVAQNLNQNNLTFAMMPYGGGFDTAVGLSKIDEMNYALENECKKAEKLIVEDYKAVTEVADRFVYIGNNARMSIHEFNNRLDTYLVHLNANYKTLLKDSFSNLIRSSDEKLIKLMSDFYKKIMEDFKWLNQDADMVFNYIKNCADLIKKWSLDNNFGGLITKYKSKFEKNIENLLLKLFKDCGLFDKNAFNFNDTLFLFFEKEAQIENCSYSFLTLQKKFDEIYKLCSGKNAIFDLAIFYKFSYSWQTYLNLNLERITKFLNGHLFFRSPDYLNLYNPCGFSRFNIKNNNQVSTMGLNSISNSNFSESNEIRNDV